MQPRPRPKHPPRSAASDAPGIIAVEYKVTFEPIFDDAYRRLPKAVRDRLDELFELIQRKPQEAVPELLRLKRKYPNIPQIYNYLTSALSSLGKIEEAEAVTRECLRRHPDYLFARINMAQFHLARGEYDKVPEIFDHTYELKLLYPERNLFHITEVVGFFGAVGMYFAKTGQRTVAEKYLEILQKLAPGSPLTQQLKRELHPGLIVRLARRLSGPVE
ncbi:MAG: hypothetical protein GXP42_07470 [Chloroflexi bacterium]|nr:hypothetical protein [Chloroflexota bacterium]